MLTPGSFFPFKSFPKKLSTSSKKAISLVRLNEGRSPSCGVSKRDCRSRMRRQLGSKPPRLNRLLLVSKLFVFALALLLIFSTNGWTFNLTTDFREGFYWQEFPIALSVLDDPAIDSQKIDDLQWALDEAIQQWTLTTPDLDFWRMDAPVSTGTSGKNLVRWDQNFQLNTGLQGSQYLAVTVRRAVIPLIAQVEILMNTLYLNLPKSDLVKILVHELGHTIGLDHSDDASSIMSAAIRLGPYSNQSIKLDDVAGVSYIHTEMGMRQSGSSSDPAYWELLSSQEQNSSTTLPSCGTIEDINRTGGGGTGSFLVSFLFGLMIMLLFGKNFHLGLLKIID